MEHQVGQDRAADARASQRTNLFLGAVLHGAGFSSPVKVRNLSPTGALVQAGAVPDPGAAVRLVRGSLSVAAQVMWSAEGQCGLHFSSLVSVREWLSPGANREQQRVDDAVQLLKSGAIPLARVTGGAEKPDSRQIGTDLKNLARLLEQLADDLLNDEAVLFAHGNQLQTLDIAVQTLDVVGTVLQSEGAGTVAESRLENLRASCRQALAATA